jgi:uncharacterized protein (TIGR02271 family)
MAQVEVILGWRGRTVVDSDGDRIGKLDEIFVNQETEKPEFALVDVGLLGLRSRLVPLAGAASEGEEIKVPYSKDQIKEAPDVDVDGGTDPDQEARLYRHYGLNYEEARKGQPEAGEAADQAAERTAFDTGMREGSGRSAEPGSDAVQAESESSEKTTGGKEDEAATERDQGEHSGAGGEREMTRSEEELELSTQTRPRGRARLKKYVVTEEVQRTVPVRREEVRVEREPIDGSESQDASSDAGIGEGEQEVVLHEEQPVVEKRTVPKERVRLDTEVVTGQEDVSDQIRKERVEVERENSER